VDSHDGGAALERLHAQAQAEAQRLFGDGPVAPWQARRAGRSVARATRIAALCGGAVLLAAAALAAVVSKTATQGSEASQPDADQSVPAMAQAEASAASVMTPEPSAPEPAAAMPSTLTIVRVASEWRIDAVAASRADAAQQLARLSGTPLLGAASLLAQARPLNLHWQGRDLAAAWQAVFGAEINYALQCKRDRCRAWFIGLPAQTAATAAQAIDIEPEQTAAQPTRSDGADAPDTNSRD
jgi:hypothetical protein